jgi:hypothetical protein
LQGLVDMNKPPEMISGNMKVCRWITRDCLKVPI